MKTNQQPEAPTAADALEVLNNLDPARTDAEAKAWDSLGRYKFEMFGYWASAWVKFNALMPKLLKKENPFRDAVNLAREKRALALAVSAIQTAVGGSAALNLE